MNDPQITISQRGIDILLNAFRPKPTELTAKRCSCADCKMPDYPGVGKIAFGVAEWHEVQDGDETKVQLVFRPYDIDGLIASRTPKTYELQAIQNLERMTPSMISEGTRVYATELPDVDERGSRKFRLTWMDT